jgi:hypothetical protein
MAQALSYVYFEDQHGLRPVGTVFTRDEAWHIATAIAKLPDRLAFSVREVVEMVKRVSGVDFKVEIAPRRPGDPAQFVAVSDRAREMLGWAPQYDDLTTIITPLPGSKRCEKQVPAPPHLSCSLRRRPRINN